MRIKNVCFSAGGLDGFYMLGCLESIQGCLRSDTINAYGSSAGAIVACLAAMRADPRAILEKMASDKRQDHAEKQTFVRADFELLVTRYGADTGKELFRSIREYIEFAWGGPSPTFKGLEMRGGRLFVVVTSLKDGGARVFGPDTTPDYDVVEAICMSCRVPIAIVPAMIEGDILLDGALSSYFPCELVTDPTDSVGVCITYMNDPVKAATSFSGYVLAMLQACLRVNTRVPWALYKAYEGNHFIPQSTITAEDIRTRYEEGRRDMEQHLRSMEKKNV